MTKEEAINFAKRKAPGYIGGEEIAHKGTDEEIIYLIELQDKIAELMNQAEELQRTKENLQRAIKGR